MFVSYKQVAIISRRAGLGIYMEVKCMMEEVITRAKWRGVSRSEKESAVVEET